MTTYKNTATSSLPVPKDTYVYCLATTAQQNDIKYDTLPTIASSDRLAVACSDDSLLVLEPETLAVAPDGHIRPANRGITSLRCFSGEGASTVYLTAGRDGLVHGWDLRSSRAVVELACPGGHRDPIASLACNAASNAIAVGTELESNGPGDVNVYLWDARNAKAPRSRFSDSHNDTITELRFLPYPSNTSNVLLSGSTDGLVNVFDTSIADEDDAVLQVINHRGAIHRAGLLGDDIYALSTDEHLTVYAQQHHDLERSDPSPFVVGDLRQHVDCEYAIKLLNRAASPLLAVGNHSNGQSVRLIPQRRSPGLSPSWSSVVPGVVTLPGGHGEDVVRDVLCADSLGAVFTCGEDGTVRLWAPMTGDHSSQELQSAKRKHDDTTQAVGKRAKNHSRANP
jgi:WD40 repeat protein